MAKTVKMIATARHDYAGRHLSPGDAFDAEEGHVQLLTVLGRARVPVNGEDLTYGTRALTARRGKRAKVLQ